MPDNLKKLYRQRFGADREFRNKFYAVLCNSFFQKYIPIDAFVIEIGAGYCEFINNIKAQKKIALDINPDVKIYAGKDVEVILSDALNISMIEDGSMDICYASNFFEHLKREDILIAIKEIYRILKPGGKLLVLQPNFRYCYKDYWMFFDHITPLDDRSLVEILRIHSFDILENKPRFLPYTMQAKVPKSILLLKIYLMFPFLQKIFGQQAFIVVSKL